MISKFKTFKTHQRLLFSTSFHNPSSSFQPHSKPINDCISSLCRQKRYKEAISSFHSLQLHNPTPQLYPSTYTHLFIACSHLKSLHNARNIHHHLISHLNPHADVILSNHILNTYGKCGSVADARKLFDSMHERNLISWASMISGYSQNSKEIEAIGLYLEMLRDGLSPDQFCLGSVVRVCPGLSDVELGRQLHCQVVKMDYSSDRSVQNALVTMYSKLGKVGDASVVFERIEEKDFVSWGAMITGFAQQGFDVEALLLFREMVGMGVYVPNEYHFGSVFSACGGVSRLEYGEQIHGLCLKFGLAGDEFAGCSLSKMYARFGRLECAKSAFFQIEMPDLASWNSIISAFSDEGYINESLRFFSNMRNMGLKPDDISVLCLLRACTSSASLAQGQIIHSYLVKMGFCRNIVVCNSLLDMYSKCSEFLTTWSIFEEMNPTRDVVSWNTILKACLQHQQLEEIFKLSSIMRRSDKMDQITINVLLNACGKLSFLEMAKQIHAHSSKSGLEYDQMVGNGLIDTYAKCGSLEDAIKLFELMGDNRDLFSWSSLIVGYAQLGHAEKSLELFTCMIDLGLKPNHVTFVGVLTACSRVGLVDEGYYYYNVMETEYGIEPTREHCACVIDLLARAGRLEEAEEFMDQMPCEPDTIMLKTLLSASRVHKNVKIAKKAAEGILKIDPYNSAAYVLLCNTLASSGLWEDVAVLRKSMRSMGVVKSPAKSWINVKGETKVFIVEDRSHTETDEIYITLDVLGSAMDEEEPKSPSWHETLET